MNRSAHDNLTDAWRDWWQGTRNVDFWATLAWFDITLRYRRSMLGPLWLTISTGLMLLGVGPVYAALMKVPLSEFFPHLTLGIIFWQFFTGAINDGCGVFIAAAPFLKQAAYPASLFVWRMLARNLIQLAHTLVLFIPVALWFGLPPSGRMLLLIPGLLIVIVNLHALGITLGCLCARFRDVPQIVSSLLAVLIFLTPVFWLPQFLPPGRLQYVLLNPLAQLLDAVRLPLLGGVPALGTYWFLLCFTCLNIGIAGIVYMLKRRQLVFWI